MTDVTNGTGRHTIYNTQHTVAVNEVTMMILMIQHLIQDVRLSTTTLPYLTLVLGNSSFSLGRLFKHSPGIT